MKTRIYSFSIIFLAIVLVFSMSINVVANRAEVSFAEEPTYKQINEIVRNGEIFGRTFEVYIKLKNTGNVESQDLTVNLTDIEGFTIEDNLSIGPGETETITFVWSTVINKNQRLITSFYPSDVDADRNQYNHGSKSFVIKSSDLDGVPASSTPGFEILIFILSAILVIYYQGRKN